MAYKEESEHKRMNQRRRHITRTGARAARNLPIRRRLATQFPRNEKQAVPVSPVERKETFPPTVLTRRMKARE